MSSIALLTNHKTQFKCDTKEVKVTQTVLVCLSTVTFGKAEGGKKKKKNPQKTEKDLKNILSTRTIPIWCWWPSIGRCSATCPVKSGDMRPPTVFELPSNFCHIWQIPPLMCQFPRWSASKSVNTFGKRLTESWIFGKGTYTSSYTHNYVLPAASWGCFNVKFDHLHTSIGRHIKFLLSKVVIIFSFCLSTRKTYIFIGQ